jgi:3-deoxy-manno-octulosonate cytidylyltransferase (CMP-KDO synthetase)
MRFLAVIPARYASTRFPGKPLALLGGKTMIQRVYEQVCGLFDEVCVATDDERIASAVQAFGGKVMMTSVDHKSGTDRCNEAADRMGSFEVIVNVQGDEPFIHADQLETLKRCFDDAQTEIATLVKPFPADDPYALLENVNSPKVVIDRHQRALYFSRSIIPFQRSKAPDQWLANHIYYKHIGLYAYKRDVLRAITALPQSPLELAESLEQLRWLENGYTIKVGVTNRETIGIDTPEDLQRAEKFLLSLSSIH